MLEMKLGGYCLAVLREANYDNQEPEGYYYQQFGSKDRRITSTYDLHEAQRVLLECLPEPVRAFVTWEVLV
jgi:hypothetical protein